MWNESIDSYDVSFNFDNHEFANNTDLMNNQNNSINQNEYNLEFGSNISVPNHANSFEYFNNYDTMFQGQHINSSGKTVRETYSQSMYPYYDMNHHLNVSKQNEDDFENMITRTSCWENKPVKTSKRGRGRGSRGSYKPRGSRAKSGSFALNSSCSMSKSSVSISSGSSSSSGSSRSGNSNQTHQGVYINPEILKKLGYLVPNQERTNLSHETTSYLPNANQSQNNNNHTSYFCSVSQNIVPNRIDYNADMQSHDSISQFNNTPLLDNQDQVSQNDKNKAIFNDKSDQLDNFLTTSIAVNVKKVP